MGKVRQGIAWEEHGGEACCDENEWKYEATKWLGIEQRSPAREMNSCEECSNGDELMSVAEAEQITDLIRGAEETQGIEKGM